MKDKCSCYYALHNFGASKFIVLLSSAERGIIRMCNFIGSIHSMRSFRRYLFFLLFERAIESGV